MIARTNMRYMIIAMLFLGWSLGNFDRFIINYAILGISEDLQLSATSTGIVLSSFFAGYALMQIPGGWLADKFGFRKVLIIAVLMWSIFTVLTGTAWSLLSLIFIRFFFGLGEGSYFPAASKGIANWFPLNERSKAMSIMLSSAGVMGVITPIFGTLLMQSIGWRMIFFIVGGLGLIITALFFYFLHEPNNEKSEKVKEKNHAASPLRNVLKTPMIWNLFIAYFSIYAVHWGLSSWMPTYLSNVKGLDLTSVGMISAIPAFVAILTTLVSGYVLDRLPEGKDKLLAAIFGLMTAIALYLMAFAPTIAMFVVYQSIVTILLSFNIILITSVPLKILSEEIVGTANGFINTSGQLAGMLTPMIIGFLVDFFGGSYNAAFIMLICFALLCSIALFLIRPKTQLVQAQTNSVN
ncbi:MFS transporter [Neobacillus drentensis]|uniref:MFS transporter n=1 Tax=Neobacillus drentensis TaxID=220684 RepID=UPI002FFE284B